MPDGMSGFLWCPAVAGHIFVDVKRDAYPVDANDVCLLVDPTVDDDPAEHLLLMLRSGEYDCLTSKGEHTIRVFGLNRPDLVTGRKDAFCLARSNLRDWHSLRQDGDPEADRVAQALLDSPFVDVVYAMVRLTPRLTATVVGERTAAALEHWRSVYGS
ncbi:hypothetical protein [Streptomyces sp. NPDC048243]|uniref:hypothetical protein n=1 Tax=Streptomyces sp. NPDC048243 TaxID=3365522 RepID=UPI00371BE5FC